METCCDAKEALACVTFSTPMSSFACILAARHQVAGDRILTFDRKLCNAIRLIDTTGSAIPSISEC